MSSTPKKPSGFEESPQAEFEGVPYSGNVSDWVRELEQQAAKESRKAETRDIRSKAGTHRVTVERKAQAEIPVDPNDAIRAANIKKATTDKKQSTDNRTSRGTSIGISSDPKTRAAAGLNPIAGLEISLEEAEALDMKSGVTATVQALSDLIQSGNPLHKNGKLWEPHRPARPEKSEGGVRFEMVTDFKPSGDQPTAIR
ncbi:MAG: excinuclease ABC subunit UvrB, partial [Rhizobiaceae bacterium]